MADTSVALASANVQLVSKKVIWRLCRLIDRTCMSPTPTLEQHLMWDDIAILLRYLLMLSFNNSLDVASHLPLLFHIVSLLVCTGPLSLQASTHGLVINIIHSLCTCSQLTFSEDVMRMLKLSLTEFSLPKFYQLFGISKVKSAAVSAFRSSYRPGDRSFAYTPPEQERVSLQSLEVITDALLEIMEGCMKEMKDCKWRQDWTDLARNFAFQYNPALQPRAIIVFGCISKTVSDSEVKQLLRILVKALESYTDLTLIEAIIMCLTRLQPLLRHDSPIHRHLFWVAVSVLQLDEVSLYAAGLALIEQNLHMIDSINLFENQSLEKMMMDTRVPLEWHFKQLDHSMGLSFKTNFNFAIVGHLLKGMRHPVTNTVSRTIRVLNMLLTITAKSSKCDKFEVTPQSVPYLAALVSVSEEVRSRCHLKHRFCSMHISESTSNDSIYGDLSYPPSQHLNHHGALHHSISPNQLPPPPYNHHSVIPVVSLGHAAPSAATGFPTDGLNAAGVTAGWAGRTTCSGTGGASSEPSNGVVAGTAAEACAAGGLHAPATARRQKSYDELDPTTMVCSRTQKGSQLGQLQQQTGSPKSWRSLDLEHGAVSSGIAATRPAFKTQRSSSMPTPKSSGSKVEIGSAVCHGYVAAVPTGISHSPPGSVEVKERSTRGSVSNENNILLDPEVLTDYPTQALLLTVLATLVRNTTDENEARILYEYLAEASVVFPKVFPVIHSLLDAKINSVLSLCHDQVILNAVHSIIQNMIACEDVSQQQLSYLQSIGFGGLWRFAGPFTKTTQNQDNAELFVNCLEAMVETCLPGGDDLDVPHTCYPGALSAISSNLNLSSSMSSLSLGSIHSPTDRGIGDAGLSMAAGSNDYLSTVALHGRHGSATHTAKHRGGSVKRDAGGGPSKRDTLE